MAAFDQSKILAKYVSDNFGECKRKIFNGYYTQEALGWTAGDAGKLSLPKAVRPRHVMVNASGKHRRVIVATAAAWAALTTESTINIDEGGVLTEATVYSKQGEHTVGAG